MTTKWKEKKKSGEEVSRRESSSAGGERESGEGVRVVVGEG